MDRNAAAFRDVFGEAFARDRQHREDRIELIGRDILQRKVFVTRAV